MKRNSHSSPSKPCERRAVLWSLLLVVLVNIGIRYPLDHATPHGSDTFFVLELGKSISQQGSAAWTLHPSSYLGLYPLSYPGGIPFISAEFEILTQCTWNAVPFVLSLLFTILLVLSGFILFRMFRINPIISVALAGFMTSSPLFMYYTYEQAAARGFAIPILVLSILSMFLYVPSPWKKGILIAAFVACSLTIHRSGFLVLLFVGLMIPATLIAELVPRMSSRTAWKIVYGIGLIAILTLFLWPFIPGLSHWIANVDELRTAIRMAEHEFRTGFFLEGTAPYVLVVNLFSNYVGSVGLLMLLFPFGILAIYHSSTDSREKDIFLILTFAAVAPILWKAQYMTSILLPFFYLVIGLAISRRARYMPFLLRQLRRFPRTSCQPRRYARHAGSVLIASFLITCVVFSTTLFIHRENLTWQGTEVKVWPSDDEKNCGLYLGGTYLEEGRVFISPSGLLDRRLGWFSQWSSPVGDATVLRAEGYLEASADDFHLVSSIDPDWLNFLASLYRLGSAYQLDPEIPDRLKYYLSWDDVNGFFRIYYENPESALMNPRVSSSQAGISVVIELNAIGDRIPDRFTGTGTRISYFFMEVSSVSYLTYQNEEYRCFYAATPS